MSRPKSDDPRKPVSVSLRTSTLETVGRAAERANKTVGRLLADLVESRYGTAAVKVDSCAHPKDREQKVLAANKKSVMLVRCGECGVRLR